MVNHRALTASVIDSREFLAARRRADTEVLAPAGTRIAFTGGTDCNDHIRIWEALDKIRAKHPDMVLLHGGSPRGAERIAACWADHRKVPQVVFKPDWTRDRNAAPFKRNDRMLEALPVGVVVFPGSGISANLADKAKKLGIPVWRFDTHRFRRRLCLEAAPPRTLRHSGFTGSGTARFSESAPPVKAMSSWHGSRKRPKTAIERRTQAIPEPDTEHDAAPTTVRPQVAVQE